MVCTVLKGNGALRGESRKACPFFNLLELKAEDCQNNFLAALANLGEMSGMEIVSGRTPFRIPPSEFRIP